MTTLRQRSKGGSAGGWQKQRNFFDLTAILLADAVQIIGGTIFLWS